MTLDDVEKAFVGIGAALIAGLVSLVRGGDIKRIEAIEKRQDAQDSNIANEVHALRTEMRSNHSEVVALIIEGRK